MLLIYALIFILVEAIGEGLLKRKNYSINEIVFDAWIQWIIALLFFSVWFIMAFHFNGYYVLVWKMIAGFIGVRFLFFDIAYNLSAGNKWYYYGTRKWYDKTMAKLGSWGWMVKVICGIIGVVFLLGYE
jgi:hypothetical protein